MKLAIPILLLLTSLFNDCTSKTNQFSGRQSTDLKEKIKDLNTQINKAYQTQKIDLLMEYYHPEITFCPEYKPALSNKKRLQQFFTDWWSINSIQHYEKDIYEIESFGDYILEDGHFKIIYTDNKGKHQQYDGMYLIIWRQKKTGQLRILSEGFCSDKYRQPKEMPYADLDVIEQTDYPQKKIPQSLEQMVWAANDDLIQIVETGDSEARIKGFTKDAIYLHHFEKMMVGMDILKPYLQKTYTPEAKIFVTHKLGRLYDLGRCVLVHGHYAGGWSAYGGGTFEGNFIKLQRKEKDGTLKTYRSWTNNDR